MNETIRNAGTAAQTGFASLAPQTALAALAVPAVLAAINPIVGALGVFFIVTTQVFAPEAAKFKRSEAEVADLRMSG
ncbi:MAG: hypothetical protein ACYCTW_12130 [Sulfuricella sp.]